MALLFATVVKWIFLCLLVFCTFVSNTFVMMILVLKEKRLLRRPLYLFILNICVSDVIACLFTMSFDVSEELAHRWLFGEVSCKIINGLEMSLFGVNIFIHLSIALERYMNVVHPLKPSMKIRTAKRLVFGAWCFPTVMALPYMYTYKVQKIGGHDICTIVSWPWLWFDKLFATIEIVFVFLIPMICLFWMYFVVVWTLYMRTRQPNDVSASSNGSTVRMAASYGSRVSIAVVSVFGVCWLPYIIMYAYRLVTKPEDVNRTSTLYITALYFSFANELLSPFIYCAFDRNIRPALLHVLCCRFWRRSTIGDIRENETVPRNSIPNENETLENVVAESVLNITINQQDANQSQG